MVLAVREHTQDLAVAADHSLCQGFFFQAGQPIENGAVLVASLIFVPVMKMDGGLLDFLGNPQANPSTPVALVKDVNQGSFDPEFLEFLP